MQENFRNNCMPTSTYKKNENIWFKNFPYNNRRHNNYKNENQPYHFK